MASDGDVEVEPDDGEEASVATGEEEPSEIGSVFSGAGMTAIIAAIALILIAVVVAASRKKKNLNP